MANNATGENEAQKLMEELKQSSPLEVVEQLATTFQNHVDAELAIKDELRAVARELEKVVKSALQLMQRVHIEGKDEEKCRELGVAAELIIKLSVVPILEEAKLKMPQGEFYRYSDILRFQLVRAVFAVALSRFLQNLDFSTITHVADILKLETPETRGDARLFLEWEVYLEGSLTVAQELARLGKNAVILDNLELVERIHKLILTLSCGFSGLNFKNDGLRRRYDSLKYDMRAIEEVTYDLKMLRKGKDDSAQ